MIGGVAYQKWTAGDGKKLDEFIRDPFAAVFCITQEMQVCPVKCYDRALYGDIGYGPIFGYNELCVNLNEMSISMDNIFSDYNLPSSFRESFYEPDETGTSKVDRIVVLSFEYDSEKLVQRMLGDKEKATNFIRKCGIVETAERALTKTQSTKEAEELVSQCSTEKEIKKNLDGIKVEKKEYQGGKCGDNCFWIFDNTLLLIGGSGDMQDYEWDVDKLALTTPWFSKREQIKNVVISEGITTIGEYAFSSCSSLTSISISDNATTIGRWTFSLCSSLTTATLPKRFESQKDVIFFCCLNLKTINLTE